MRLRLFNEELILNEFEISFAPSFPNVFQQRLNVEMKQEAKRVEWLMKVYNSPDIPWCKLALGLFAKASPFPIWMGHNTKSWN